MRAKLFDPERHPRGLPRPLGPHADGLKPIPWSQDQEAAPKWGIIDDMRAAACQSHSLCLICGHTVGHGQVLLRVRRDPSDAPSLALPLFLGEPPEFFTRSALTESWIADNGPMHDRCMAITLAHCKTIREGVRDGIWHPHPYRANG